MQRLTEAGDVITLGYPAWLGLLFAAGAVALAIVLSRGGDGKQKLWSFAVACLVCVYAAWHFLGYKVTIGKADVTLYEPLRHDKRIPWTEVSNAGVERRSSGRGGNSNFFVIQSKTGEELAILLSGLSLDDQSRVMDALTARLK